MQRCYDCKHYDFRCVPGDTKVVEAQLCRKWNGTPNPVIGDDIEELYCKEARLSPDLCGWKGKHWQKK